MIQNRVSFCGMPINRLLICIAASLLCTCKESREEEIAPQTECLSTPIARVLTDVEGRIEKVASYYLIEAGEIRYVACNLPENVKAGGTIVRFDAQEFTIPANVRLPGTPIVLTRIY